ncbi:MULTISPECIES: hypothetical protein [Paraburkholderia]|uniref:Uncharacterized protein n=1 Tax=Paraburkholderia madseniana TaxID=2599607 RepID=A0AAP5B8U8_9BURK|nr:MULTISPECIES: hypothetical protein [Paraburkholderia]MCX4145057.1 hypothetical protein [Paraburkholderia madseniana]MDN7148008.1 hypothetical protein [Paraburkholderia sp. WS6]MDQ6406888.1 hypothetical protein [Paraburkholderia madseniana]
MRIVRDRQSPTTVIAEFVLGPEDIIRLVQVVKEDLARLGEHNFARYRVTLEQVCTSIADGRPQG